MPVHQVINNKLQHTNNNIRNLVIWNWKLLFATLRHWDRISWATSGNWPFEVSAQETTRNAVNRKIS